MLPQSDIDAANQAVDEVEIAIARHHEAVARFVTERLLRPNPRPTLIFVEDRIVEALRRLDNQQPGIAHDALERALAVLREGQ